MRYVDPVQQKNMIILLDALLKASDNPPTGKGIMMTVDEYVGLLGQALDALATKKLDVAVVRR